MVGCFYTGSSMLQMTWGLHNAGLFYNWAVLITENLLWIFILCIPAKQPVCLSTGAAAQNIHQTRPPCSVFWCWWSLEGSLISLETATRSAPQAHTSALTVVQTLVCPSSLCLQQEDTDISEHICEVVRCWNQPVEARRESSHCEDAKYINMISFIYGAEQKRIGCREERELTERWHRAKRAAVRSYAGHCPRWRAICERVHSYWPILVETKRADGHLSLCQAERVSSVAVEPPACTCWRGRRPRYGALGPGCVLICWLPLTHGKETFQTRCPSLWPPLPLSPLLQSHTYPLDAVSIQHTVHELIWLTITLLHDGIHLWYRNLILTYLPNNNLSLKAMMLIEFNQ